MKKPDFLKVPKELLQYSIENHFVKELRTYLILKMETSGTHSWGSKEDMVRLNTLVGYKSVKSTKKNIAVLLRLKWLNYDEKSKLLFIKGFEGVRRNLSLKIRTGVYLYANDLTSIEKLKAFASGSIINSLIISQRSKIKVSGLIKGNSKDDTYKSSSGYYPVALSVLMTVFRCSKGQAFILKKLAKKYGYINIRKKFIKTGYRADMVLAFKKSNPHLAHRVICKNGNIVLKDSDLIKGYMQMSRRKKLELYKRG